jgi:Na+/H+ antiporter NhaC
MAGTDLFTHIRYMTLTVPTYVITLIIFIFLGLSVEINGNVNSFNLLSDIEAPLPFRHGYSWCRNRNRLYHQKRNP